MTKLAVWTVLLDGRELLEVPYKAKTEAEQFCEDYNKGVDEFCPGQPKCYLNLIKRPVETYPDTIVKITTWNRRIGGTNKETGQGWSKTFFHVDVHSVVMNKYELLTKFVGHYYRGEYRVTGACGSLNLEEFSKWVKKRWPDAFQQVYLEFLK